MEKQHVSMYSAFFLYIIYVATRRIEDGELVYAILQRKRIWRTLHAPSHLTKSSTLVLLLSKKISKITGRSELNNNAFSTLLSLLSDQFAQHKNMSALLSPSGHILYYYILYDTSRII